MIFLKRAFMRKSGKILYRWAGIACWIDNVTNTHSEFAILAFALQQNLHERASISHTHRLPVFLFLLLN
jgi:hypothetical protein